MHNNYFLLRHLIPLLEKELLGLRSETIFSQNRDELILTFSDETKNFTIKAIMESAFTCLSFPEDFRRARRNSADLFPQITGLAIEGVNTFSYDRSFVIDFEHNYSLILKLYGNRSNILLFEDNACIDIFKHNLKSDLLLTKDQFGKQLTISKKIFEDSGHDYLKFIPAFGKVFHTYFEDNKYNDKEPEEKWHIINKLLRQLDHPDYFISNSKGVPVFRLYPDEHVQSTFSNPIKALNAFCKTYTRQLSLNNEKSNLFKTLRNKLKRNESYIDKTRKKLLQLKTKTDDSKIADIIMANLHLIPPHAGEIKLFNFYDNNEIIIKLKPHLSPQKNAEDYYRKSKNRRIENENLEANRKAREKANEEIRKLLTETEETHDIRQVRKLAGNIRKREQTISTKDEGYHRFEFMGYQVLVGKNAKKNDLLTFKVAKKNDLWLHARDTPGSHVIIRQKPGSNFPRPVIEWAAGLAAYYSKRKNESLCPVMYTERKFVRKTKHLAPGQVIVEKEKSILVKPHKAKTK